MSKIMTITIFLSLILLSGCTKYFTLGSNKGYCEEHGCDYSEAGLCVDAYDMYQNKDKYYKHAYDNIDCSQCGFSNTEVNIIEE